MKRAKNAFVIRAGRHGEREARALEEGVATIGFDEVGDLRQYRDRQAIKEAYAEGSPNASKHNVASGAGQLLRFATGIKKGDVVVLPSKFQPVVHVGEVTGSYTYNADSDLKHRLPVSWKEEVPRTAFDKDLLYSFGSLLTVSRVRRDNAAARVLATASGTKLTEDKQSEGDTEDESDDNTSIDIPRFAEDQIVELIERTFDGHEFSDLITEILRVQGYTVKASPPGPDGGIDILAAAGPLGFQAPHICVQVKKTKAPADVKVLRELMGVMRRTKAQQGLFVSWNGFNKVALKEARDDFFSIRLWSSREVLEQIYLHYTELDEKFRAKIPLRRVWVLVEDE